MLVIVPFIIILLIPLSPVGHVLVFGFIQRFFPDFYPSQFTEQRQNIMSMYSSITNSATLSVSTAASGDNGVTTRGSAVTPQAESDANVEDVGVSKAAVQGLDAPRGVKSDSK